MALCKESVGLERRGAKGLEDKEKVGSPVHRTVYGHKWESRFSFSV